MSAGGEQPAATQVKKSPQDIKSLLEAEKDINYLDVRLDESTRSSSNIPNIIFPYCGSSSLKLHILTSLQTL